MATKKVIAKKDNGFMTERPSWMEDKRRGSEGVSTEDMVIPRVDVFQALSPQINKRKDEYIEGAEAGLLYNTATGEIYGEELIVVPVYYRKEYVIWKDRDAGGGFRGAFPSHSEAADAIRQIEDGSQCDIVDTGQHFALVKANGSWQQAVLSMSRSKMGVSRKLNTQIHLEGGDRWSRAWKLEPVSVEGPKGDYFSYKFTALGYVDEETYHVAEQFWEAVRSGQRDVDRRDHASDGLDSPEL